MRIHDHVKPGYHYPTALYLNRAKLPGEIGFHIRYYDGHVVAVDVSQRLPSGKLSLIGGGAAVCSPFDTFDPYLGEEIALARAINHLPKSTRTRVWQAYHGASRERKGATVRNTRDMPLMRAWSELVADAALGRRY